MTGAASVDAEVAATLETLRRELARLARGRLSLIGTPAEENGGGKELIIRAGGFDDVDAAGMVHPSSEQAPRRCSASARPGCAASR